MTTTVRKKCKQEYKPNKTTALIIREGSSEYQSTLQINNMRTCTCGPTHINCLPAKEWLKSQLGVCRFTYESREQSGITPGAGPTIYQLRGKSHNAYNMSRERVYSHLCNISQRNERITTKTMSLSRLESNIVVAQCFCLRNNESFLTRKSTVLLPQTLGERAIHKYEGR